VLVGILLDRPARAAAIMLAEAGGQLALVLELAWILRALEITRPAIYPLAIEASTKFITVVFPGEHVMEIEVPETSNPLARSIRVQVAPSLAGPILGALDFLTSYAYGCTEQTLSSFVPNLAARRALTELNLPVIESLKSLDRQVTEGLARLYDFQHGDGGWGWWKTDENHPFMTASAVYGLIEARSAGYKVDQWRITNGVRACLSDNGRSVNRPSGRRAGTPLMLRLREGRQGHSTGCDPVSADDDGGR